MKRTLVPLVACLAIGSVGMLDSHFVSAQDTSHRIPVTAKRFAYDPAEITLKKGQPVVLVIKSLDTAHGLRFRDLDLNVMVDKNGSGELSFTPQKTGDFVGHCSVFCGSGHGSMTLTLHVVD